MIVLDASAFLELLLRTAAGSVVEGQLAQDAAATPHVFDAEVFHRLIIFGKHGVLSRDHLDEALALLGAAAVARLDARPLLANARRFTVPCPAMTPFTPRSPASPTPRW